MAELQANFELPRRSEIEATFEINIATKGDKGDPGNGIESIEKTSTQGLVDTYTIQYTDGDSTTFDVTNGKDGVDGKDGKDAKINGVNVLSLTATNGLSYTQSGGTATISGNTLQQGIADINAKIPEQASASNQLADKEFVNSSIATNTANFIGTFDSVEELEAYSGPLTNNDYAFVIAEDEQGNTVYDRYKYTTATTPPSWQFEYELNNSSFTADQWAAINSGATDLLIGQITTNKNAIGTLSSLDTTSKTDLVSAINEVKSTADGKVSDVTVNGTSVVSTGTAVIPLAAINGDYGLVKIGATSNGLNITGGGNLYVYGADNASIDAKSSAYRALTPSTLDYAVKVSVTTNTNTLTATEKSNACDWLGAVKDVTVDSASVVTNGVAVMPNASGSNYGVTKLSSSLTSTSNTIAAAASTSNSLAKNIITGADVFDKTLTYAVGDKVRYGTGYYECITDITTGHAWNSNEWRQITIQSEIDEKQDTLTPSDGGRYIDIVEQVTLPTGYSRLDYVLNDSTSPYTMIDLGIKPQDGDVIETVFQVNRQAMSNYFIQARENASSSIYGLAGASSGSTITCAVNGVTADSTIVRKNSHKYYVKASIIDGVCSIYVKDMTDNIDDFATNTYTWADINQNYHLWGNGVNTLSGEQPVQFVKITNKGSVRLHYVAATNGSNAGFYDLVNNQFVTTTVYGSLNAGNVIANPAIVNTTFRNKDFIYYATSSTAAATVEKVVNIPEITQLEVGQMIVVQPTATSTVANSTIKLNSFDAYPMRYNNAAITTSTDSVVWASTFPSWWIFDGTYWVFYVPYYGSYSKAVAEMNKPRFKVLEK